MPKARPAPGGVRAGRRKALSLPPAFSSAALVIRIAPRDVGLFRFLLEGRDNLGLFTVLDSRAALLKLLFSPHQTADMRAALAEMAELVPFAVEEWPAPRGAGRGHPAA
ncbi:MAG: DUF4911 domain-containing protein [Desulfovibrionaceae bacterium]|nr:DUF4911 domain-containing protein [Desulfovibrionaceae bacterium]